MIIGHIGSYDRNLGDNIAILNVRNEFEKQINFSELNWVDIDIGTVFWNNQNSEEFVINLFKENNFDAVVIGGGGLIEFAGYDHHQTKYKLPFNKKILKSIKCPTFFVGLGINYFRGMEGASKESIQALHETIEYSTCFSLRNDGSINILKDLGIYQNKVREIPDPGLIFNYEKNRNFDLKRNYIQPAFNANESINENRFKGKENILKLVDLSSKENLIAIAHTPKDYKYFNNFLFENGDKVFKFRNGIREMIKLYLNFDFGISMRGHGQLVSIGLNLPGLYFSTQDKVRDFSLLNGFSDYNIDIDDDDWFNTLSIKYNKMLTDKKYIQKWFDIRDKNIIKWKKQMFDYIKECKDELSSM